MSVPAIHAEVVHLHSECAAFLETLFQLLDGVVFVLLEIGIVAGIGFHVADESIAGQFSGFAFMESLDVFEVLAKGIPRVSVAVVQFVAVEVEHGFDLRIECLVVLVNLVLRRINAINIVSQAGQFALRIEHTLAVRHELVNIEPMQRLSDRNQIKLQPVRRRCQTVLLINLYVLAGTLVHFVGFLPRHLNHLLAGICTHDSLGEGFAKREQNLPSAHPNIHVAVPEFQSHQALTKQRFWISWTKQLVVDALGYKPEQIFLVH